jgi:hypothetical protein
VTAWVYVAAFVLSAALFAGAHHWTHSVRAFWMAAVAVALLWPVVVPAAATWASVVD